MRSQNYAKRAVLRAWSICLLGGLLACSHLPTTPPKPEKPTNLRLFSITKNGYFVRYAIDGSELEKIVFSEALARRLVCMDAEGADSLATYLLQLEYGLEACEAKASPCESIR